MRILNPFAPNAPSLNHSLDMCRTYWMMVPGGRESSRRRQRQKCVKQWSYRRPFIHKGHDPARYAERFERFERDEVLKVKTFVPFVRFVFGKCAYLFNEFPKRM